MSSTVGFRKGLSFLGVCMAVWFTASGRIWSTQFLFGEEVNLQKVEEIKQRLSKNAAALDRIQVDWERFRDTELGYDDLKAFLNFPEHPLRWLAYEKVSASWEHGMYHVHYWRDRGVPPAGATSKDEMQPNIQEQDFSFDGQTLYKCTPNKGSPSLISVQPIAGKAFKEMPAQDKVLIMPRAGYFYEAGYTFPITITETSVVKRADHLVLKLISMGAVVVSISEEEIDSTTCQSVVLNVPVPNELKEEPVQIFYLAVDRNHALRRRITRGASNEFASVTDCYDFVLVDDTEIVLPRRIETKRYTDSARCSGKYSERPICNESLTVSTMSSRKQDFKSRYHSPGDYVFDGTVPGAEKKKSGTVDYRVPANFEDLDRVIHDAVNRSRSGAPAPDKRRYLLIVNVAAVLLAGAYLFWRFVYHRKERS